MVAGQVLFLFVVALMTIHSLRSIVRGRIPTVTITAVSTAVYFFVLWVPAHLQNAGLIQSKLEKANFALPPTATEIGALSVRWAVELTILCFSEWLVWRVRRRPNLTLAADLVDVNRRHEFVAVSLVVVGVLATLLYPVEALETRGSGGEGLGVLLRTFLIVGLTYLVYFRAFGRPMYWILFCGGVVFLLANGVRSPLLVVACGFLASQIRLGRLQQPRVLAAIVALLLSFATAGALMSNFRANDIRNTGLSTSTIVAQTLANPWIAPYESGLDTLDGYRFSMRVSEVEGANPSDLLNVVTTFVPRALWPEKPSDLSVTLSSKYLGYESSGQYLSPTGYLTLTTGSYGGGLIGLAVFAASFAILIRRYVLTFWYGIILCVIVRFMLGGSSFDLYYGLTLALPVAAVTLLAGVHRHLGKGLRLERVSFRIPLEDQSTRKSTMGIRLDKSMETLP